MALTFATARTVTFVSSEVLELLIDGLLVSDSMEKSDCLCELSLSSSR
jgi:hypothetical protein